MEIRHLCIFKRSYIFVAEKCMTNAIFSIEKLLSLPTQLDHHKDQHRYIAQNTVIKLEKS